MATSHIGPAAIVAALKVKFAMEAAVCGLGDCAVFRALTNARSIFSYTQSQGQMQHDIANLTIDVQPTVQPNATLILVTGKLKVIHNAQLLALVPS